MEKTDTPSANFPNNLLKLLKLFSVLIRADEARRLREEAALLPPGAGRQALERKARQAETSSHMSEWLRSPGLEPPT